MTPDLRAKLERAIQLAGTHTLVDVEAAIAEGKMLAWHGVDSIIITQIAVFPQCKELIFFLAAGNMDEMRRLHLIICAWGKEQGCARAVFAGRPGWARSFLTQDEGWHSHLVVFEKEL